MLGILNKLFDSNNREVSGLQPIVDQVASLEPKMQKLKDTDFPKKTEEFKKRVSRNERLEDILPEAFALVREASLRAVGMRHFDVQIMAAVVLSQGKIAEQKTGEGKTLSALPALYLHALTGKGVHLVTVNDYLARRDAGWMGPVFDLLGISVSSIINNESFIYDSKFNDKNAKDFKLAHLKPISRKEAYSADVTYGINSEFGFDYLRDNMENEVKNLRQRGYYFAVVDEVDSVLIDEARTPHIISAPDESPSARYYEYAKVVDKLSSDTDYNIDEKLRTVHLTDHGIGKIEKLYGVKDIYEKDFDTVYHLEAALKARTLFKKEKDYIVKDNQVILVDEFTGRLMEGRRLSDGIHQAIEAKENVAIQRESKTLATVSLQNYFRMYEILAGMTGTAVTESEEFRKIYNLDVVVIPTNNPLARIDNSDAVYKTGRAKISAVVSEIEAVHKTGQPILIGTTSIEKNEIIGEFLKRRKIRFELLNAKNHLREAEIIADAGKIGAVTVATNMAGRGVDIVLGGEPPKKADGSTKQNSPEYKKWKKEHDEVKKLGGLYVIGTERHESRRIDNQLRGRSGRQGDPGASKFFVALDDEIMRIFGGDRVASIMTRFNMPEDVPLEHPLVSKSIENAQVKVEGFNFDTRKHLVEYDDVLNKQREIIYDLRRKVLESEIEKDTALKEEVQERIESAISMIVNRAASDPEKLDNINEAIVTDFTIIIPFDPASQKQLITQLQQAGSAEEKIEFLKKIANDLYRQKENQLGGELMRRVEKFVMLGTIDKLWMNHLDAMDSLRGGIGLRGYAQKDPLVEYKNEGFKMFENLMSSIDDEIVHRIYKVQVQQQTHTHEDGSVHPGPTHAQTNADNAKISPTKATSVLPDLPKHTDHATTNTPASEISTDTKKQNVAKSQKKLGRNDPCWCGSSKKFKKCHYPEIG